MCVSLQFFDDSANRAKQEGRWTSTSTTIGACLHELGHCLSLPHPCAENAAHGGGIMSRGFDHLNRLFMPVRDMQGLPFWDRGSAARLRFHRFLQCEYQNTPPSLENLSLAPGQPMASPAPANAALEYCDGPYLQRQHSKITRIRSHTGIGHVGYYKNGDNASHEEFEEPYPKVFDLPALEVLSSRCQLGPNDVLTVSAIDIKGNISEATYKEG